LDLSSSNCNGAGSFEKAHWWYQSNAFDDWEVEGEERTELKLFGTSGEVAYDATIARL
jgi:hypothetical protein